MLRTKLKLRLSVADMSMRACRLPKDGHEKKMERLHTVQISALGACSVIPAADARALFHGCSARQTDMHVRPLWIDLLDGVTSLMVLHCEKIRLLTALHVRAPGHGPDAEGHHQAAPAA